jgi:hypothetical protein
MPPVTFKTLSLSALTADAERWTDPQEWLLETSDTFQRECEAADPTRRAALARDFDYELWEFFQEKFAQGGISFASEVLKTLDGNSKAQDEIPIEVRNSIVRNTAAFQYCGEIGPIRKKLLQQNLVA